MEKLYKKLILFRDKKCEKLEQHNDIIARKNKNPNSHLTYFERAKDVIGQLFIIAYYNKDNPDNLPSVFNINKVHFSEEELKSFFREIGYDVKVKILSKSWNDGTASFKVTIVNIHE